MTSDFLDRALHLTFTSFGPGGGSHIQGILNKWCRDRINIPAPTPHEQWWADHNRRIEVVLPTIPGSASASQMFAELDLAGAVYSWRWVQVDKNDLRPTIWERLEKMT